MNFRFHTESEIKRSVPLNFKPEKFICLPQGLVSINDSALAGLWLSLNGHARENFRQQVSKDNAILRLNMTEKYAFLLYSKEILFTFTDIVMEIYTIFVIHICTQK